MTSSLSPQTSSSQPQASSSQPSTTSQSTQPEQTALEQHLSALETTRKTLSTSLAALTAQRDDLLYTILNHSADTQEHRNSTSDDTHPNTQEKYVKDDPSDHDIKRGLTAARTIKAEHVRALQKYNEIKDIAQGLIGLIAEQRGVRVVDVMAEIGAGDLAT